VTRCQQAVAQAAQADQLIAELRRKRAEEVAAAFVYKREPSVADIDAKIAEAEAASYQAQVDGEAARVGLEIIEARCAELNGELDALRDEARSIVLDEANIRIKQARQSYETALSDLGEHVIELAAAISLRDLLHRNYSRGNVGVMLFTQLQECDAVRISGPEGRAITPRWMPTFAESMRSRATALHVELDKLQITA
jgi:hypothetical protein